MSDPEAGLGPLGSPAQSSAGAGPWGQPRSLSTGAISPQDHSRAVVPVRGGRVAAGW